MVVSLISPNIDNMPRYRGIKKYRKRRYEHLAQPSNAALNELSSDHSTLNNPTSTQNKIQCTGAHTVEHDSNAASLQTNIEEDSANGYSVSHSLTKNYLSRTNDESKCEGGNAPPISSPFVNMRESDSILNRSNKNGVEMSSSLSVDDDEDRQFLSSLDKDSVDDNNSVMSLLSNNASHIDGISTPLSKSVVCDANMSATHENVSLSPDDSLRNILNDETNLFNVNDDLSQDLITHSQINLSTPINSNANLDVAIDSDSTVSDTESHTRHQSLVTKSSLRYHSRRRLVRNLIQYIQKMGNLSDQALIVSEAFKSPALQSVLEAAGIIKPKEFNSYEMIVKQLCKQLDRSSAKSSLRGRVNDDLQSYRTNAIALLMPSPNSISEKSLKDADIFRLLCNNTSIPKRTARRLLYNAKKHRLKLTKNEKDTTWSLLKYRNKYNTQQSILNSSLFEWIINHPHVVSSPILKDTIIVKVPNPRGELVKERVGKLLLEISVRELHLDLISDPPTGFPGAYCKDTNKLKISESHLRNVLPPQLRAMTCAQKQMCGCECCTISKMLHESLLKFRRNFMSSYRPSLSSRTRSSKHSNQSSENYRSLLQQSDEVYLSRLNDIVPLMSCPIPENLSLPKLECVMGRCSNCPSLPIPAFEFSNENYLDPIHYGMYMYHTKCKKHGVLKDKSASCPECTTQIADGVISSPEKIIRKKEITLMKTDISSFHDDVYVPAMNKYKYHIFLVSILSKNYCKKMRYEAFEDNSHWLFSERDYAERLTKELDAEIQSDHFGDNQTLSIEGVTLQLHNKLYDGNPNKIESKYRLDFHSHLADFSKQDAATCFEHTCAMLDKHINVYGPLPSSCVIMEHTDGCAKQYRSGNALYLMNVLCLKYHVTIDRAVCAPGHGKSIIDGFNAVDKHYLRKVMCMSGTNRHDSAQTRMDMYAMTEGASRSFAEECARLCSQNRRKYGSLSSIASKKLKLSERHYYVQDPNKVRYCTLSIGTKGWNKCSGQMGNGIQHHYNFRADPDIGVGFIAVRRIPCACKSCTHQLSLPWEVGKAFDQQQRYLNDNDQCDLWYSLGSLNNWKLISFVDRKRPQSNRLSSTTKSIFNETIRNRALSLSSLIEIDKYAAISTDDNNTMSGYYICIIRSLPYYLQRQFRLNHEHIPKGELVCDMTYLNPVPRCHTLFSHGLKDETSLDTTVRVQHIIDPRVKWKSLDTPMEVHTSMRSKYNHLISLNTIVIDEQCHHDIIEKIYSRSHLEHSEYYHSSDDNFESDYETDDDL